jgi:polysaccharide export outer membrane protein/exopolysaccharide production protein ExoF
MSSYSPRQRTRSPIAPRHCFKHFPRAIALAILAMLALPLAPVPSFADATAEYLLGPQDRIRVKAFEWRATRDEIFEWKALNSEYVVSASGKVSLPFVGEIPANGVTTAELSKSIAQALSERMGLAASPDISVEVVKFRPFYIMGNVDKPGEYAFRPELNVLQAVTIAGGLQRASDARRLERDVIAAKGDLSINALEVSSLLSRKARLEAELKNRDTIEFPKQLADRQTDARIAAIMAQEKLIFDARRDAMKTQIQALEDLKKYLASEVVSIEEQLVLHGRQLELLKKERDSVVSLVNRGLAVEPRRLGLERNVAQLDGDRLRLEGTLSKAKQDISRTEISLLDLRNGRLKEVTTELRATQAKLDELALKARTTEDLLYEAEILAPGLDDARDARQQPIYTIVRHTDGQSVTMTATETTAVEPGDAIKVELPLRKHGVVAEEKPKERKEPVVSQQVPRPDLY